VRLTHPTRAHETQAKRHLDAPRGQVLAVRHLVGLGSLEAFGGFGKAILLDHQPALKIIHGQLREHPFDINVTIA
jgi:hypothetical protein